MESALSVMATNTALISYKRLYRFPQSPSVQCAISSPGNCLPKSTRSFSLQPFFAVTPPLRRHNRHLSSSVSAVSSSGGGNSGFGGDSGGGGDGGSDGGDSNQNLVAEVAGGISDISSDVIVLNVGGCAASVKRILESQPQVSSATVNLAEETAIVWPVDGAKVVPDRQKQLGEELAKHLTSCGFKSNLRGQVAVEGEIAS